MNPLIESRCRRGLPAIALVLIATASLVPAGAAAEIYFKLDGDESIASENTPEKWRGWIGARAFGKGLHCPSGPREGGAVQVVPRLERSFEVIKFVDAASPLLARAVSEGRVFPRLVAFYLHNKGTESRGTRIILENVRIESQQLSGGRADAVTPSDTMASRLTEEIAFSFESAHFSHTEEGAVEKSGNGELPGEIEPPPADENDTDEDGLSDGYEARHGLDPHTADAGEDTDGDGQTNEEEFAAGTAPDDRQSRFGIDRISLSSENPGRGLVSFYTLPGRRYRVLGSPTGETWFELTAFSVPRESDAVQQEVEFPVNGLVQLLRVQVAVENGPSS